MYIRCRRLWVAWIEVTVTRAAGTSLQLWVSHQVAAPHSLAGFVVGCGPMLFRSWGEAFRAPKHIRTLVGVISMAPVLVSLGMATK